MAQRKASHDGPPLRGDQAALAVPWKRGDATPAAARQARFYLERAFLYGSEFLADALWRKIRLESRSRPPTGGDAGSAPAAVAGHDDGVGGGASWRACHRPGQPIE